MPDGCPDWSYLDNPYQDVVVADGALAYWPLDPGTPSYVTADATGNSRDLTWSAGAPTDASMLWMPGGVTLNADSTATSASSAWMTNIRSVEAWVQASGAAAVGTDFVAIASRRNEAEHWALYHSNASGIRLTVAYSSGLFSYTLDTGTALTDGVLHHVVAEWTNTDLYIYVDGTLAASTPATDGISGGSGSSIQVGSELDTTRRWIGDIGHVAFYPTVLGSERVVTHYVAGLTAPVAPTAVATADVSGLEVAVDGATSTLNEWIGCNGAHVPPPSLSNAVAVWWAEDLADLADGDPVTSWTDRVGSVELTSSFDPPTFDPTGMNGKPSVFWETTFGPLSALTGLSDSTEGCVVAVLMSDAHDDLSAWWSVANNTVGNQYLAGATWLNKSTIYRQTPSTYDTGLTATPVDEGVPKTLEWSSNGSAWSMRIDNLPEPFVMDFGTNTGDWFGDVTGRNEFAIGEIPSSTPYASPNGTSRLAFLGVYDAPLSPAERAELYAWINSYYGALSLTCPPVSYDWDFGDGGTATGPDATHTYSANGTYTVTLTVTDQLGCVAVDSVEIEAGVDPCTTPPTAAIAAIPTVGAAPLSVDFDGSDSFAVGDATIASYSWDFGDGITSTDSTAAHVYVDPGTYTATLTVTDTNDCTATDSVEVTVVDPVPLVGTCALQTTYADLGDNVLTAIPTETSTKIDVDWSFTPVIGGATFTATLTALEDLSTLGLSVIGVSLTSDGAVPNPEPSSYANATLSDLTVVAESGVDIGTPVTIPETPGAMALPIVGLGGMPSGASLTVTFTLLGSLPTLMAGIGTPDDEGGGPVEAFPISLAWVSNDCVPDPCSTTLTFNGTYELELGVEGAPDYLIWRPTFLSLNGETDSSIFFLGVNRVSTVGPTLEGFEYGGGIDGMLLSEGFPASGYSLGWPSSLVVGGWPEAGVTGYRFKGANCGTYTLWLYGRRMASGGPIEVWASTDGVNWTEVSL